MPEIQKHVILYSGGMDSFILGQMFPDAMKLYINIHSRYSRKEMAHLPDDVIINSGALNLREFEREDAIIPCRNMLLALIAAQYGNVIMLGATAGDQSRDKDTRFAYLASGLLNYMLSGPHFRGENLRDDPGIVLPIKGYDKTQLVAEYLRIWKKRHGSDSSWRDRAEQYLLDTVSCYDPTHTHCGHCKSCVRKWVALEMNNIEQPDGYWHQHPTTWGGWGAVMHQIQHSVVGWRTDSEDHSTRVCLEKHSIWREVAA